MTRPTAADIIATKHNWYHVIDLADGVTTPGWIDLRTHLSTVGFPDDMTGMRALDIGMFDGFWAFEMERRGAQVIGIDIDDIPPPDIPRIHYDRIRQEAIDGDMVTGRGFQLL